MLEIVVVVPLLDEHVHSVEVLEVIIDGTNDAGFLRLTKLVFLETNCAILAVFTDEYFGLARDKRIEAIGKSWHNVEILFLEELLYLHEVMRHFG
jgi:hypothetical protein